MHMPETIDPGKRPRGRPRRNASSEEVGKLRTEGFSYRQIARSLGFGYGTVRRALAANEAAPAERPVTGENPVA